MCFYSLKHIQQYKEKLREARPYGLYSSSGHAFNKSNRWGEITIKDEEQLLIAGWKVSPDTLEITQNDHSIKLEPKVMALLLYLANRAGEVVSREKLEADLWPGRIVGYDALSNTINKLRKAFSDSPRDPQVIQTIPKTGYRLIGEVKKQSSKEPSPVQQESPPKAPAKPVSSTRYTTQRLASRYKDRLQMALIGLILIAFLIWWLAAPPTNAPETEKTNPVQLFENPSVVVLPFNNLSKDSEQNWFSDGITHDLVTDLSKVSALRVIARNSASFYAKNQDDIASIGKALNVDYLVRGSVQRDHDRIRLNVYLVDTRNEDTLWAERYDRKLTDLFQTQDELTEQVVTALKVKLAPEEKKLIARESVASIEAYDAFLRGQAYFGHRNPVDNQLAKDEFARAIELAPEFARAYSALALSHAWNTVFGSRMASIESLDKASEYVEKALQLDDSLPQVYYVKSQIALFKRNYESAAQFVHKAIDMEPGYADAYAQLAWVLHNSGQPGLGLEMIEQAIELDPHVPAIYLMIRGALYYALHKYEAAIKNLESSLQISPNLQQSIILLAATYAARNQHDDAAWQIQEMLTLHPDMSIDQVEQTFPIRDPDFLKRLQQHLLEAGLPET